MRDYHQDGYVEHMAADLIEIGTVLREVQSSGNVPAFGDAVVIGIKTDGLVAESLLSGTDMNKVELELVRPYVYANTVGSATNYLLGNERFTAKFSNLKSNWKVVMNAVKNGNDNPVVKRV